MTNKFENFIKPFEQRSDDFAQGAATAWQHRQNEIDQLKDQLINMEHCYIQMKKERDDAYFVDDKSSEDTSTPQVIIDAERKRKVG